MESCLHMTAACQHIRSPWSATTQKSSSRGRRALPSWQRRLRPVPHTRPVWPWKTMNALRRRNILLWCEGKGRLTHLAERTSTFLQVRGTGRRCPGDRDVRIHLVWRRAQLDLQILDQDLTTTVPAPGPTRGWLTEVHPIGPHPVRLLPPAPPLVTSLAPPPCLLGRPRPPGHPPDPPLDLPGLPLIHPTPPIPPPHPPFPTMGPRRQPPLCPNACLQKAHPGCLQNPSGRLVLTECHPAGPLESPQEWI